MAVGRSLTEVNRTWSRNLNSVEIDPYRKSRLLTNGHWRAIPRGFLKLATASPRLAIIWYSLGRIP
jgi:hypothetical protein